jgi:hypothetical protein
MVDKLQPQQAFLESLISYRSNEKDTAEQKVRLENLILLFVCISSGNEMLPGRRLRSSISMMPSSAYELGQSFAQLNSSPSKRRRSLTLAGNNWPFPHSDVGFWISPRLVLAQWRVDSEPGHVPLPKLSTATLGWCWRGRMPEALNGLFAARYSSRERKASNGRFLSKLIPYQRKQPPITAKMTAAWKAAGLT